MGLAHSIYEMLEKEIPESPRTSLRDLSDAYGRERCAAVQAGYLLGLAAGLRMSGGAQ